MKITLPKFSDQFINIYRLAKLGDETKLNEYIQMQQGLEEEQKEPAVHPLNVAEFIKIDRHDRKISPLFLLAFQGEAKAVQILLDHGANRSQALFGYALAGNMDGIRNNLTGADNDDFHYIAVHLAYGGHYEKAADFYAELIIENPFAANFRNGFISGMGGTGIVHEPQRFLYWLATHIQYKNPWLFSSLVARLCHSNIIQYDPDPLAELAQQLSVREGVIAAPKAVVWPQLYVWLWQAPRLMEDNKLPLEIFIRVASFLCFNDKDAEFLATEMVFRKTKQLFLSHLHSIMEDKTGGEPSEIKEKRLPKRLLQTFAPITNPEKFSIGIVAETKKQEARYKDMRSRRQSSLIPLLSEPPAGKQSDPKVLAALQRCDSRVQVFSPSPS